MDVITEVYALYGPLKHPIHGKKVEQYIIKDGKVYANLITTRPQKLFIKEGNFLYTKDVRTSGDVAVQIPHFHGFHEVSLQLGRFRCSLEYTVR